MKHVSIQINSRIISIRIAGVMVCAFLIAMNAGKLAGQTVRIFPNQTELTTDDNFVLNVEVRDYKGGHVPMPKWPDIPGFQAVGSSTSQNWVNGRVSVTFFRTYVPTKTGSFTVPAMSYKLKDKVHRNPAIKLKVTKGSGRRQQPQTRNPMDDFFRSPMDNFFGNGRRGQKPQKLDFKAVDADYFLSVNLNQDTAYIGEQVRGEVVLYVNQRDQGKIGVDGQAIMEMQQRIKNPSFWQENIELREIPMARVQINGTNYIAYTLYRTILFPLQVGSIPFKDIYLEGKKVMVATNASPLDKFFRNNTKFTPIRIKARDNKLEVLPLPPTNLPNANMVGKFKMTAELNSGNVQTGDNLELTVNIKGDGNVAMMLPPSIQFPAEFISDAPNSEYKDRTTETSFYGDKTFKYFLVPRRGGEYDLGPLAFYYFNAAKNAYDSLVVSNIPVKVTGEDLDNLMLKQSGLDGFYETALAEADDKLKRNTGSFGTLVFLGVILLMAGAVTFNVVRNKARANENDQQDEVNDPWGKR